MSLLLSSAMTYPSLSADYYVSSAGLDSNNGLTTGTSWLTFEKAMTAMQSTMVAGDALYFNKGDTFTSADFTHVISNTNCLSGLTRCTVGAYGTGANPIINKSADQVELFKLSGSAGWVFNDLDLRAVSGDVTTSIGIAVFAASSYPTIERVTFTDFGYGMLFDGAGGYNYGANIKDSYFDDNSQGAILGNGVVNASIFSNQITTGGLNPIGLTEAFNNYISDNIVIGATTTVTGIHIPYAAETTTSNNNTVNNNKVILLADASSAGIDIDTPDAVITNNQIILNSSLTECGNVRATNTQTNNVCLSAEPNALDISTNWGVN